MWCEWLKWEGWLWERVIRKVMRDQTTRLMRANKRSDRECNKEHDEHSNLSLAFPTAAPVQALATTSLSQCYRSDVKGFNLSCEECMWSNILSFFFVFFVLVSLFKRCVKLLCPALCLSVQFSCRYVESIGCRIFYKKGRTSKMMMSTLSLTAVWELEIASKRLHKSYPVESYNRNSAYVLASCGASSKLATCRV